jgi:AraC-like DNA-binding protein
MKPQLLKISKDQVNSFSARKDVMPDINNRWHYHPEVELIYFKNGNGTQFIGDSISPFLTGDVVLVGANLPHFWQFDNSYFSGQEDISADINVIHFNESFLGESFLALPENQVIKALLEKSKHGIQIRQTSGTSIGGLIESIINTDGPRRIMLLLEILTCVYEYQDYNLLSSLGFRNDFNASEKDRINKIYNYLIENFKKEISLKEIAAVGNISPNSFCKFFKSRSRKTYTQFIREIRIGHACKLLIDNNLNIKEICYESGFNNFSSFHKHFKLIKGKTPLEYQKNFLKENR